MTASIWQIALATPLRRLFDYRPPPGAETGAAAAALGSRVAVPFGARRLIGILVARAEQSAVPAHKLRAATRVLDRVPVFDAHTFETLRWAADYYHHPVGEVFAAAMPSSIRNGDPLDLVIDGWTLTSLGAAERLEPSDRRSPKQRALLAWLAAHSGASGTEIRAAGFAAPLLRAIDERNWVIAQPRLPAPHRSVIAASPVELTAAQADAVAQISAALGRFNAFMLFGVTGSGKTEVYLRVIAEVIATGRQTLVLVPEIALTPQLLERFRARFDAGMVVLHSGLTESDRRAAWQAARSGRARVVIGTRSAVFTPMPSLALIVVDEEHDTSFKQQEGFRYSARDVAVLRAQKSGIPVVLGSATPSLETLENAKSSRYRALRIPQRPGAVTAPKMTLIDMRLHASEQGLSQPAIAGMARHLAAGGQVIVFLNRRGFAPTLFCTACAWVAQCAHCEARMTVHRRAALLRCHHCGSQADIPASCGACGQPLTPVGQGTERVEETLGRLFPQAPLARLDRDSTSAKGSMQTVLATVHSGAARILVGTQMLTKGHHFPEVSLVVILDADQGLFATDYRAAERLAQTITQVAGRAGRESRAGEVIIQTQFPDHPLLKTLVDSGYERFAISALQERLEASWPPYTRLALLRADAPRRGDLDAFLVRAAQAARALNARGIKVLGPADAPLARRADRHRAQLLIEAASRPGLQRFLREWLTRIEALPQRSSLRWTIDVDPLEVD